MRKSRIRRKCVSRIVPILILVSEKGFHYVAQSGLES